MNHQVAESDFQMETVQLAAEHDAKREYSKHLKMQIVPMNKHIQFKVTCSLGNHESYHSTLQSAIEAYNEL